VVIELPEGVSLPSLTTYVADYVSWRFWGGLVVERKSRQPAAGQGLLFIRGTLGPRFFIYQPTSGGQTASVGVKQAPGGMLWVNSLNWLVWTASSTCAPPPNAKVLAA
jgi:hypothetical protein